MYRSLNLMNDHFMKLNCEQTPESAVLSIPFYDSELMSYHLLGAVDVAIISLIVNVKGPARQVNCYGAIVAVA